MKDGLVDIIGFEKQHMDALALLYVDVFAAAPWHESWEAEWARQRMACVAESPNFCGLVAVANGKLMGAILGRGIPFKGDKHFEIVELFVAQQAQGKGVGTELLHHLEQVLQQQGYGVAYLATSISGDPQRFYQRNGYAQLASIQLMTKSL